MKKIITVLSVCIFLVSFSSCAAEDMDYSYSIRDALKISAWVLDESLDKNGYWVENEGMGSIGGHGQWVENETRAVDSYEENVFVLESLKLNEVRTMAPFNYANTVNLTIFVEFDGVVEVEVEDELILLSYNDKNPTQLGVGREGRNVKIPYEVYVNICPGTKYPPGSVIIVNDIELTDREYYVNVNAYRFENQETPIIRAQLKLLVLEDKGLPANENKSRFMSIELVSYEYSDVYKIMDEIWDDEDDY